MQNFSSSLNNSSSDTYFVGRILVLVFSGISFVLCLIFIIIYLVTIEIHNTFMDMVLNLMISEGIYSMASFLIPGAEAFQNYDKNF